MSYQDEIEPFLNKIIIASKVIKLFVKFNVAKGYVSEIPYVMDQGGRRYCYLEGQESYTF